MAIASAAWKRTAALALGLVLDERHVQQADDAVADGQPQVHAAPEVAHG